MSLFGRKRQPPADNPIPEPPRPRRAPYRADDLPPFEWDESSPVSFTQHRGGIWYYDAPMPPTKHQCVAWTSSAATGYSRCACGGISERRSSYWWNQNSFTSKRLPLAEAQAAQRAKDAEMQEMMRTMESTLRTLRERSGE